MYSIILLGLMAGVFIIQSAVPGFTQLFWFDPQNLLSQPWGFVTAIFLHGSLLHLFFNGFALIMFGPLLERSIGSKKFLQLFFLAGIVGSVLYYLSYVIGLGNGLPALGASGAIYGVLGAIAVLAPNLMVLVFFVPMPMRVAAVVWVLIEFFGSLSPGTGIASAAHLGGLFLGFIYAKQFLKSRSEYA